jgi:hypothetical protein
MLTIDELKAIIASYRYEPLTPEQLRNMCELLAGSLRNLPLRSNRKDPLLLQVYLAELALAYSHYTESNIAIITVINNLTFMVMNGTLSSIFANAVITLAQLIADALAALNIEVEIS